MRNLTFGTFFVFIFLAFFANDFSVYAQSCNTELSVYKNRNARSASENDSTRFQLELTNNTSSSQSYQIEVANFDGSFTVNGRVPQRLSSNAELNTTIVQNNIQKNTITVPASSSVIFQTKVSVPPGTPFDRWGGLEVKAINSDCPDGAVTALLKLQVTNPSEE